MTQNDQKILDAIERAGGGLLSARQIADEVGLHPGEYKAVQQRLRELARAGAVEREGRRFRLARAAQPIVVSERPKRHKRGEEAPIPGPAPSGRPARETAPEGRVSTHGAGGEGRRGRQGARAPERTAPQTAGGQRGRRRPEAQAPEALSPSTEAGREGRRARAEAPAPAGAPESHAGGRQGRRGGAEAPAPAGTPESHAGGRQGRRGGAEAPAPAGTPESHAAGRQGRRGRAEAPAPTGASESHAAGRQGRRGRGEAPAPEAVEPSPEAGRQGRRGRGEAPAPEAVEPSPEAGRQGRRGRGEAPAPEAVEPSPEAGRQGRRGHGEAPATGGAPASHAASRHGRRGREEQHARRPTPWAPKSAGGRTEGVGGRELRHGEIIGTLTLRPEGYGFVARKQGPPGDDVFLPPHEMQGAMDGDLVRVRIVRGKFGRDAGMLLEILSHRRRNFLGTYETRGRATFVVPVDPTLPRSVAVAPVKGVRMGQVVKVAITGYAEEAGTLRGDVVKVVGEPGDPIVEVLEVAYSNGFAEEFPGDVRDEAEAIPDRVTQEEIAGRRDLRPLHLVTIDGADARDFDDAVCVERMPRGGYRLVVAIADVAHYVRPGTRLDEEAVHRGTSVYFPNHVLPMLPEKLSNGICSLNPGVDRLCMVSDIALDADGRPVEAQIYEAVMRSHARCTYEQVAELLAGTTPPALGALEEDLRLAGELAAKLRRQRSLRGALDFDLPEAKAVLDEHMLPTAIERRERNDAHRLIEEFMLAANEAVARHFSDRDLPTVYRVHAEPDPEKLERFASLARSVGFSFDVEEGMPPGRVAAILREIEGTPQQRALNSLLLRSMMQAIYQPENIGHYGLASEHYLHFTSPIRRYPDLLVHRLLKELWARAGRSPKGKERDVLEERLDELAAGASERERAATDAEREIDQYFKCLFVQDKVGEAFDATVIALTDFGFFAELNEIPVEGLVRAEELGTSWELDEERHRLVFPATGRSFAIGDQVRVEIAGVDLGKRQISLAMVVSAVAETAGAGEGASSSLLAAIDRRRAMQPKGGARAAPQGRGAATAKAGGGGKRDGRRTENPRPASASKSRGRSGDAQGKKHGKSSGPSGRSRRR